MGIKANTSGIKPAGERLERKGRAIMVRSGSEMQRVARAEAPVDSGALKSGIVVLPTRDGAVVVSTQNYSVFVERGTGLYAEGGGGRKTPWVYERDGRFITTQGHPPQKFMAPGFDAGVAEFARQKRQEGL